MAAPLLALPFLGKLGTALGALKGFGATAAAKMGATAIAKKGGMRMAGDALKNSGKFLLNNMGANKSEVAFRLGPDLAFGGLTALTTPGDLGDKIIAGGTQAAGGILGGVGAGGLAKNMGVGQSGQLLADMAGSFAGDYVGMYTGDALMRAKGGGMTPYERLAAEGDMQRQREIEERLMQVYGLAGHRPLDPFLAENGLGG